MPPAWAGDFLEDFAATVVGEVAVAPRYALFGGPRASHVGLQELGAVVGFDGDEIHLAQAIAHVMRDVSEIGQPSDRASRGEEVVFPARSEGVADRLLGVVRDGKRIDLKILKSKTRSGLKRLPIRPLAELRLNGSRGGGVGEHRQLRMFFDDRVESGGVVTVFMGQEDRADILEGGVGFVQHLPELSTGETGVDEHAGGFGLQERSVARAATA